MPLIATRGAASAQGFGEFAQRATAVQAEAIDFDGTNDFLSRSTDLVGNTDGQSFTLSFWLWRKDSSGGAYVYTSETSGNSPRFTVYSSGSTAELLAYDSGGTLRLYVSIPLGVFQLTGTFYHILVSVNKTSTATRSVYVNDVLQSVTWNTYSTTNNIDFTNPIHTVMGLYGTTASAAGRVSNLFLDYTYRDMSITANRRLFVTADLKPAAGQSALNPILYLPLNDPTAPGVNAGTGGNFTLTGTVARSGRGPNQYNAPYSDLDGSADYLSRTTAPTGIADGKQLTVSGVFNFDSTAGRILVFSQSTNYKVEFALVSGKLTIECKNAAGSTVLSVTANQTLVANRNYQFVLSCDMTDSAKRWLKINGEDLTNVWSTYVNDNINFSISSTPRYLVGATSALAATFNGRLGALWFNTSYIDLSSAANLAKFVTGTGIDAKPVDLGATGELPTGTSPIIYLPMYGNNAGKNYGTGGDFTVNSGPYTGARGPNEFWGNKIDFNGNSPRSYLSRTSALVGVSNGNVISGSFWCSFDSAGSAEDIFRISSSGNQDRLRISKNSSDQLNIRGLSTGNTSLFNVTGGTVGAGDFYVQFCFDLSDSAKRFLYINGVSAALTITTYTDGSIGLAEPNVWVGTYDASNLTMNGRLAEFYISASYIDFSQEANRLKFRDCFGNPTNLPSAITAATVPTPAIYLRFDPTSFGTNSGTGGNFTVTSTPTDGGQL